MTINQIPLRQSDSRPSPKARVLHLCGVTQTTPPEQATGHGAQQILTVA